MQHATSNTSAAPISRWSICAAFLLSLTLSLLVFGMVALQSPGFDDEMANMELIEHLGTWPTAKLMQTEDVHPPGGYVLNGLLFDALQDWSLVRGVSALLYAITASMLGSFVLRRQGWRAGGLALLFVLLSPAALMWCTSLRWYSYFVPLLIWTLITPSDSAGRWYFIKPALGWLMMAYINYAALILAPVLLLWYGLHAGVNWKAMLRQSWLPWLLAGLAFVPQLFIFLTVHARHAEGQACGPIKALLGAVISMASNQGLFPISFWGMASMVAWGVLLAAMLREVRQDKALRTKMWAMAAGLGVFVLTGLAGKFRNLVLLSPMQTLLVAQAEATIRRHWLRVLATTVIVMANALGCLHVAQHRDTTKNGWNLPVRDTVSGVRALYDACPTRPVVYTFDPVIARALRESDRRLIVANYFDRFDKVQPGKADCAIVIHTYKGALPRDRFEALLSAEKAIGAPLVRTVQVQLDGQAALKRKLDPDFPDYLVELRLFQGALHLRDIDTWASSRK